jgi:titin
VVTKYLIERGLTNASFAVIDSVSGSTTSYANTSGLTPQTTYVYRVDACNSAGCSSSNEASATTLPVPPGAPSGLSANAVSASQIDLAWGAASGTVAGYRIERSTSAGGTFAQIDTVAGGVLSYSNTGLASGTEFFYRVRACNSGGCSGYSNVASDTTFLVPPTAPTSVTATSASSTQINVTWSGATGIIANYEVFRKDSNSSYQSVATPTGTSYSDTGLAADTKYFYQIRACNSAGCSGLSPEVSTTTFPPPPSAPGTLTAGAVSSSQINLTWGASTGAVGKYVIERRSSGSYAVIDSTTSTSYSNTGLNSSTQYFYQVRACNASGCSSYSNEASATTAPVPPSAPTNVDALISGSQINVSWTGSTGVVDSYKIEWREGGGGFVTRATVSGTSTTFSDTGPFTMALNQSAYRIQACNSSGCSAFSNVANAH